MMSLHEPPGGVTEPISLAMDLLLFHKLLFRQDSGLRSATPFGVQTAISCLCHPRVPLRSTRGYILPPLPGFRQPVLASGQTTPAVARRRLSQTTLESSLWM